MNLYEYEGKALLKQYNIQTATGWLLDDVPENITFPVMLKAQVLTGGRGKLGGIRKVNTLEELKKHAREILSMKIKDEVVTDVYVEEMVQFKKEYYISIVIDRNYKSPVLIVSSEGGVDIEEVEKDKILVVPINPLLGLQDYMVKKVEMFLNTKETFISEVIHRLWDMFKKEQADLVEINPLFILNDNEYVAGDAKVSIDDSANRPTFPTLIKRDIDSFEAKCLELGTVGVELDGDVSVITSGAGLGMATFDLVSANNVTINSLVDLGGHVIHDEEAASKLMNEIKSLKPKALLFNFYFQVASCLVLAKAIENEFSETNIPVIIRLRGQDEAEATELLSPYSNIIVTDNIDSACHITADALKEVKQ